MLGGHWVCQCASARLACLLYMSDCLYAYLSNYQETDMNAESRICVFFFIASSHCDSTTLPSSANTPNPLELGPASIYKLYQAHLTHLFYEVVVILWPGVTSPLEPPTMGGSEK